MLNNKTPGGEASGQCIVASAVAAVATIMEKSETGQELSSFLDSGIYRFQDSKAVFVDPVRILNRSYTRFRVSPSTYYSRFFGSNPTAAAHDHETNESSNTKKRRLKEPKPRVLNERELAADRRHQKVRPLLLDAHHCLLAATDLLKIIRDLRSDSFASGHAGKFELPPNEPSFIELGKVWQAPLYEITLNFVQNPKLSQDEGAFVDECSGKRVIPAFNNFIANETDGDAEAEFLGRKYVIPRKSSFYMSDLGDIHNLIPDKSDYGFNLIVVDPPWENASAHQKLRYPTLPNRYFLSLRIKELVHRDGALVALWVTNREKLLNFVEKELFPSWGVSYAASFYWLKVKAVGSLVSDLDLFHHRPYECLLLGYHHGQTDSMELSGFSPVKDDRVVISIPGDYSRKPPVGELLLEHVPGLKPARCIELFAREILGGWTSWGNEPLHFQDLSYFQRNDG